MEAMQAILSRLHSLQQQNARLSDSDKVLATGLRKDEEGVLQKKLSGLDAEIKTKLKVNKKANTDNMRLLRDLQAETELKRAKKAAKERLLSTLEEELAHLTKEKKSLTEVPENEESVKRLEEEEGIYVRQLALEINKIKGGWLQFVFTQINPQKPLSRFMFSLKVDENRTYIVSDCQPELDDMDAMVEKLNSSNKLGVFVHSVRKRFVDSVHK